MISHTDSGGVESNSPSFWWSSALGVHWNHLTEQKDNKFLLLSVMTWLSHPWTQSSFGYLTKTWYDQASTNLSITRVCDPQAPSYNEQLLASWEGCDQREVYHAPVGGPTLMRVWAALTELTGSSTKEKKRNKTGRESVVRMGGFIGANRSGYY